jgi:type VI secretion system protein VasG
MITDPSALLRRLNSYCAKALEASAELCQTRAHPEIMLEHWLLKLLEQGTGDISLVARHYQLDLDKVWQGLLNYLDTLPHTVNTKPSLSSSLIGILQSAWLKASLEDHQETIRSVHILQTLQEMPHCLKAQDAWQLLSLSVVSLQKMRTQLDETSDESPTNQHKYYSDNLHLNNDINNTKKLNINSKHDSQTVDTNNNQQQATQQRHYQAALNRFTEDITEKAKTGKIDPVFGRDSEIRQMIDILSRRRKNNPILVGEPGVGKTALVEGLALRIAEGNVPKNLEKVNILALDLGLLQAGAGVKGEFEQRLKNVIEAVQQSPTPILLFIDEAHTIIGAGNSVGGADAANLLKPALARGELRTIAATTWSEYKQYFEKDAALERRFQIVKVEEPDDEKACLMLRGLKSRYAKHHGVHILDEAVKTAVSLSRRYISGRQLPDKAVDLLDTASARVRMGLDTIPESITLLEAQITSLTIEQEAIKTDLALGEHLPTDRTVEIGLQLDELQKKLATQQKQFEKEKKLVETLIELRQKLTSKSEQKIQKQLIETQQKLSELQKNSPLLSLDVDSRIVSSVIADWTGVPLDSLLKDEQSHLLMLEADLRERVVGQDNALFEISKRIRAAKTGLTSEDAPIGVFLLVGPSGVGKTETALALSDTLFGGEQSLITINMSEYQESHTVSQLKGSPPGYVGYGQGGILTEAVRKRPYSVVLLDEVEKAHRDVLNLFYQVFDRGFMRDGEGRKIDFRNTLILMTSNLGSDQLMALFDEMPDANIATQQELLRPIIREHFQPALLARFQTIIYTPLANDALRKIVEMKLNKVSSRLQKHYKIEFNVGEKLYDTLVSACLLPDTGARNIDSILNQQILPVVSNLLLQNVNNHNSQEKMLQLDFTETDGIVLEWVTRKNKVIPTKSKKSIVKSKPIKKNDTDNKKIPKTKKK